MTRYFSQAILCLVIFVELSLSYSNLIFTGNSSFQPSGLSSLSRLALTLGSVERQTCYRTCHYNFVFNNSAGSFVEIRMPQVATIGLVNNITSLLLLQTILYVLMQARENLLRL